ncbi:DUF484 family protein [Ferrimonas balearica]|uniref:DUF484 family protein n=1 Tax=Ferrimonas balearica TaxID=44012 RepID=UPI001C99D658|nr:DUF484 family protein [Ferrimonas balearica]MBY5993346.1 DUF484 family protein [Ferrimonas balearica]
MSKRELIDLNDVDPVLVREYLLDHPDFFARYPELLLSMRIPHPERGTVSLVERQQMMLRDRVNQLEEEITSLLAVAARNEEIYRFYGKLIFDLLACDTLEQLQREMADQLRQRFRFGRVRLHIASPVNRFEPETLLGVLRRRLNGDGYYLGRLPAAEAQLMVGLETGSVALIGLGEINDWIGVVAIASHDPGHFVADMDTLLLDQLKHLLNYRVRQLLTPDA